MKSIVFAAVAAILPAFSSGQACNADNCLRALKITSRPGLEDCKSYLRTTITPATSTVTATVTETAEVTPTVYYDVTESRLVLVTATATDVRTQTTFITTTQTFNRVVSANGKRQATAIPTGIPAYASPCSGAVRYSSACSCLGATAATLTAGAPTVTVTQTDTLTVSPVTVSLPSTVATEDVSTTVATAIITTTVATIRATETATVFFDIKPQCADLAARNMLYMSAGPNRYIDLRTDLVYIYPYTEDGRSRCCTTCHGVPDCSIFTFDNIGNGHGRCMFYVNRETTPRNQSPQCPKGIVVGANTAPGGSTGFGLGPCFRD